MDIKELEELTDVIVDHPEKNIELELGEVASYFLRCRDKGEKIVLNSLTEKQISRLMFVFHKFVISAMTAEGSLGMLLIDKNFDDDLEKFGQNLVLSVLGALYEDGVL